MRSDPSQPLPPDIIWRTERALNDPDCQDASTPDRCAATAGKRYQQSRLGWAAQTLGETCYESNGRLRRYSALCGRRYSWGTAREDYVLPDAHTVSIRIAPQQLGGTNGECTWSWQARKAGGKTESKRTACTDKLTIARVPYALDRTQSGVSVTVKLPDGRELAEPEVVVDDHFIVALGDSFASGESNPDRPVQFSAGREMVYEPSLLRAGLASKAPAKRATPNYAVAASDDRYNPRVLPRRFMDDEAAERFYGLGSPEFLAAFEKASARWLSRDCHRSQYGYPFRVAIELALGFASGLARLPAPSALAVRAAKLLGRDPDSDRVRLGPNVIFSRRAPGISALAKRRIAAGTAVAVIAGLAQRLSRPAEAALLIALAGGRRAAVGRRGILAVGIVERPFGAPDDVRRERLR